MEVKLKSWNKAKRLRDQPKTFSELQELVETHFQDARDPQNLKYIEEVSARGNVLRDYSIKYTDPDNEQINVSDDDDLYVAYKVAEKSFHNKLQLFVQFKTPQ